MESVKNDGKVSVNSTCSYKRGEKVNLENMNQNILGLELFQFTCTLNSS